MQKNCEEIKIPEVLWRNPNPEMQKIPEKNIYEEIQNISENPKNYIWKNLKICKNYFKI